MGDLHDALTKAKQRRYVAFVDLLGFGAAIKTDWSEAARTYAGSSGSRKNCGTAHAFEA